MPSLKAAKKSGLKKAKAYKSPKSGSKSTGNKTGRKGY